MRLGFELPVARAWASSPNEQQIATRAVELGSGSLWCFPRLLVLVQPRDDYSPLPGRPQSLLFRFTLDPTVDLAHVVAATQLLPLGFAALNLSFHTPVLAQQVAPLDYVSDKRAVLALGLGWSQDEYEAVGVLFHHHGARLDDFVDWLRVIWAGDMGGHHGSCYSTPAGRLDLPRVQESHPAMVIGGDGAVAIDPTVARGGGFVGGNVDVDAVIERGWTVREGFEPQHTDRW